MKISYFTIITKNLKKSIMNSVFDRIGNSVFDRIGKTVCPIGGFLVENGTKEGFYYHIDKKKMFCYNLISLN